MAEAYAIESPPLARTTKPVLVGPRGSKWKLGTPIVYFKRTLKDVLFTTTTHIEGGAEPDPRQPGLVQYAVREPRPLDPPRELKVLAGGLEKVQRFDDPQWHFRRPIVALTRADYDTIVENNPDIGRSIFRYLFHAMPVELQAIFVGQHPRMFPRQTRNRSFDYYRLASLLVDFVEETIVPQLSLLRMVRDAYPKEIEGFPPFSEWWLRDGGNESSEIPFGSAVEDILDEQIGTRWGEPSSFLLECRSRLDTERGQWRRRRWPDQIF